MLTTLMKLLINFGSFLKGQNPTKEKKNNETLELFR
jgi:hypothetical protein